MLKPEVGRVGGGQSACGFCMANGAPTEAQAGASRQAFFPLVYIVCACVCVRVCVCVCVCMCACACVRVRMRARACSHTVRAMGAALHDLGR